MSSVIRATGLGKQYRRYLSNRPFTLQEAIVRGLRGLKPVERFWALRDISFEIGAGKIVGVLGPNGAGKSTLLRLIGGVGKPDEGSLQVKGRTGALIDLGAGFHADLTGRDNVFINGIISGLNRREVEQRFDSIVDFAELEDFIDSPLRTYSSGMQMRLGFAIATHTQPEILLVDEVLAVGDISFQQKCYDRIAQFKADGCAILMVSHDPGLIARLCDEAMWLRGGRMAAYGPAEIVADQYLGETKSETERRTPREWPVSVTSAGTELRVYKNRIGSMEMEITDVCLTDLNGDPVTQINSGDGLRVEIEFICPQPVEAPIFEVRITTEDDSILYGSSMASNDLSMPTLQGAGKIALEFERLDLSGNKYFIDAGVYKGDWSYAYDYHWHVYPLTILAEEDPSGPLLPPHHWERG